MPPRLFLASASPRRADLLRAAGFVFDVLPADVDESVRPDESPRVYARRVAMAKAEAVLPHAAGRVVLAADTVVIVDGQILGKPADAGDARRMLRLLSGRMHHVLTASVLVSSSSKYAGGGLGSDRLRPAATGDAVARLKSGPTYGTSGPTYGASGLTDSEVGGVPAGVRRVEAASGAGLAENGGVRTFEQVTEVTFAPLSEDELAWYVASGEPMDKAGAYAIQGLAARFITGISGSYSNVVGLPIESVYRILVEIDPRYRSGYSEVG